jgi:predicted metal-dependent hydrolase
MANKTVEIEGVGSVSIYKRRGQTSVKLSITAKREIRVTIPAWAPYAVGIAFAQKQSEWLRKHLPPEPVGLKDWQPIGKKHHLRIKSVPGLSKPTRRSRGVLITVSYPPMMMPNDPSIQALATKASIEALRDEAEELLPNRLQKLATAHGFTFHGVQVKKLTGRWGSCSSKKLIVLNLYLMQLPWELIDYVLFHELTHTKHMNHSTQFWDELIRHEPRARALRRQIHTYKPVLQDASSVLN